MKVTQSDYFWRHVKFFLLLAVTLTLGYILLTKYLFRIPQSNNDLLTSINNYEIILNKENQYAKQIENINNQIKELDFNIRQVQKQEEIKISIENIRKIYTSNNQNANYLFADMGSKLLQLHYDTKQKVTITEESKNMVKDNLQDCIANIQN